MSAGVVRLNLGDVLTTDLPGHVPHGREQEGFRPAVVVGLPTLAGPTRFPMVLVAPVTTDRGQPWAIRNATLYPALAAGAGGLPSASIVLLDQIRAVDPSRLRVRKGTLSPDELGLVQGGLRHILSL